MPRTDDLIESLARDLTPVRAIPPIRLVLAGALVAWSVVLVLAAWLHEPRLDLARKLLADPVFTGICVGLVIAALAGCIAGLAAMVPGRDALERAASWVGAGGLLLALGLAIEATATSGLSSGVPYVQDARCFATGTCIGLVPGLALLAYVRRGHVLRADRAAAVLLIGPFALGALAVQVVCHHPGPRHMLLGHASIPLALLLLGVVPLALWLPRLQR